jgi:hypothetical protein
MSDEDLVAIVELDSGVIIAGGGGMSIVGMDLTPPSGGGIMLNWKFAGHS